jgi:hypothetical protein
MENLKTSLILDMPAPSEVIEPVAPPPPPLPGYMKLLKTSEQGRYLKKVELESFDCHLSMAKEGGHQTVL